MIRLFLALVSVAAALGAENKNYSSSKRVTVWNFRYPSRTNNFDTPTSFENFNIIANKLFLKEVEECHSKYPKIDNTTFYKHVYCSLKNEEYTTSIGISCNITKPLFEIIEKKLNDFEIFRNITNTNESCWKNNFRQKRNSLDSDLLPGVELMGEKPKEVDKKYIYLGPTRFPMTTDIHNRLFRVQGKLINPNSFADEKKPAADEKKSAADGKKKIHKPPRKIKPIRVPPKNFFHLMKFFKFRKFRQPDEGIIKTIRNINETDDPFHEIEGNTYFYFKLLETLVKIAERFSKRIEEESKALLGGENLRIVDMRGKNTENGEEEKKKPINREQKIEKQEKKKMEEEESSTKPRIFGSLENSYRKEPPKLYYTLSWEDGTKVE